MALLYNDYLINILTCVALSTRFQDAFETCYPLVVRASVPQPLGHRTVPPVRSAVALGWK